MPDGNSPFLAVPASEWLAAKRFRFAIADPFRVHDSRSFRTGGPSGSGTQHCQRSLGFRWYRFPMETVIDQAGRIVLPKPIRDALGLLPGTRVDISPYGAGAQVVPAGRTARLVEEDGVLVSAGDTPVDDGVVFALIDAGRR